MTIEIYWNDLTEAKRKEIMDALGDNGNWDVYPMATIEIETDPKWDELDKAELDAVNACLKYIKED